MIISAFRGFGPGRKSGQQQGHYTLVRTQKAFTASGCNQFVFFACGDFISGIIRFVLGLFLGAVFSRNADQSFFATSGSLVFSDLSSRTSGSAVFDFCFVGSFFFPFYFCLLFAWSVSLGCFFPSCYPVPPWFRFWFNFRIFISFLRSERNWISMSCYSSGRLPLHLRDPSCGERSDAFF